MISFNLSIQLHFRHLDHKDQQKARLPKSAPPRRQNLRSVLSRRRAVFITPYFETKSPWRKAGTTVAF
jgi:hypothetical protein